MSSVQHLVVLALDEQRLAVPLATVDRIVRAVEVTPLPGAPQVVLGVINVQGAVLPVINLRRRCRLPEREIETTDMLVIAHTTRRSVALLVDRADVMELLYDPEALLLLEEDIALNGAMAGAADAADAADAEGASDE
jgi:purine-binding chemotaxis protein CheW